MGLVASLISVLKAEVEWLITSLAVASGSDDGTIASDTQTANATGAAHRDNSAPDSHAPISALAQQQPDNNADHSSPLNANSDGACNAGAIAQLTDVETHSPANLLVNADFLIDTTDNSSAATSPGLTPTSLEQTDFDLSGISTPVGTSTPHDQEFQFNPIATDSRVGIIQPHSGAGEFTLASLTPQMLGGFAHGKPGGGGGGGGGNVPSSYASGNPGSLQITLNFDSSVANAPVVNGTNVFAADMDKVADFFTSHYANNIQITIDVGFGEVAGSHISAGDLGESESFYTTVPGANGSSQYSALVTAFGNLASKDHPAFTFPGSDPVSASNQQWWVTTAEGKALGLTSTSGIDGYVGFSGGAGTFAYDPANVQPGQYDFIGVAAHEISEVLGRVTLNGGKYFGGKSPEYMPLDVFHFSDASPGSHSFSGTAAGYFSLDGSGTAAEGYKEFNTSSSGDFSDWAVSTPSDAYDWSGGQGVQAGVSYADYLVMEAVGFTGTFTGTASDWQVWG